MPGICGIVSRNPVGEIESDLDRMADALRHFSWYASDQFVAPDARFAVARVQLKESPVAAENRP